MGGDIEVESNQVGQRMGQPFGRQLVANLAAFPGGRNEPAPTQAVQVVGDVGPSNFKTLGEFERIGAALQQREEYATSSRICQSSPHSLERSEVAKRLIAHAAMYTGRYEFMQA